MQKWHLQVLRTTWVRWGYGPRGTDGYSMHTDRAVVKVASRSGRSFYTLPFKLPESNRVPAPQEHERCVGYGWRWNLEDGAAGYFWSFAESPEACIAAAKARGCATPFEIFNTAIKDVRITDELGDATIMKTTSYTLGAGPHTAQRVEHVGRTVEIRMFDGKILGHGNTTAEAAAHLGAQLQQLAYFVECHEGAQNDDPNPNKTRTRQVPPRKAAMKNTKKKPKQFKGDVDAWCARHDQNADQDWLYFVLDGTCSVDEMRAAILADRDPVKQTPGVKFNADLDAWCDRHDNYHAGAWLYFVLDGTYSVAEMRAAVRADRQPREGK